MSDETVFREVDEALRRDRLNTAWRRYGPYLIGAAVLIVLLVAANEGWNWWQTTNAARSSDQFYTALDAENNNDLPGALKALDTVIAQGSGQYPVLARFKQAALLAKQGDKDKALAEFDALATNAPDQRLKEAALLLGANVLVDKGDVPGVKQRVEGLLGSDNPLHNSARETLGLAQYKAGDLNGARDSFAAVMNDPLSPDEARSRMQIYIGQLVAQGATPPATQTADSVAGAAAAAVQAAGAAAGGTPPAPANDNTAGTAAPAADSSAAVGVESSQPVTPDSSLELAVPAAPAAPATNLPSISTGLPDLTSEPAPSNDNTAPPPAGTTSAPATAPAASTTPAPATGTPAPTTGTTGQ